MMFTLCKRTKLDTNVQDWGSSVGMKQNISCYLGTEIRRSSHSAQMKRQSFVRASINSKE